MFVERLVCYNAAQDPGERRKAQQHSKVNAMHFQARFLSDNNIKVAHCVAKALLIGHYLTVEQSDYCPIRMWPAHEDKCI